MDANNILHFPKDRVVRQFENSVIPEPSHEKDIENLAEEIMSNINISINDYHMADATDEKAFREYCLVQQAVLSLVKKLYGEEDHHLQEFANYYIEITNKRDDGTLIYTAHMPSLAFLEENGTEYTIVNFEEEI